MTVAHICDSNLPAAISVLAETDVAERVLDSVIGLERIVRDGLEPLAEGRATGKIVVEVSL